MIWFVIGFVIIAGIATVHEGIGMLLLLAYWFLGILLFGETEKEKVDYKERFRKVSQENKTIIIDYDEDEGKFIKSKTNL